MRVTADVLDVLDRCATEGPLLRLPAALERQLYLRTDKVLQACGGKWNRRQLAHVFPADAADAIEQVLLTGEVTTHQETGFFPTPPAVAAVLLELADVAPGMRVLEPSAGEGHLVSPLVDRGCIVDAIELDAGRVARLSNAGARWVEVGDFLLCQPAVYLSYDRAVMNPPFARQADIAHVEHALRFLKPDGLLVSVMAAGVTFRQGKAARLRQLIDDRGGRIIDLPDGSFKPATGVRTVVAVVPTS